MMPKVPKIEEGKLFVEFPEQEQVTSDIKSPISSPRVTRRTTAALAMADLDLSVLFKFVKPYDGNRETLNSFIVNCDNAFELASDYQKPILFKYILSQLNGKAEIACSIKEFISWDQLKDFLKTQFSERKHLSHLLTDLQESKQGPQDTVSQYALRVETYLSQLLTEISLSNTKVKELPGRTAAMEDLALHHFTMGLHPRISNIVRCRSPRTLNEAINYAISEERIQQTLYRRPQPESKPGNGNSNKFKSNPPRINQTMHSFSQRSPNFASQWPSSTFCRYCKAQGHTIENCIKRRYNNNNRFPSTSQFQRRPEQDNSKFKPTRVNFIDDNNHDHGPEPRPGTSNEDDRQNDDNYLNE